MRGQEWEMECKGFFEGRNGEWSVNYLWWRVGVICDVVMTEVSSLQSSVVEG